MSHSQHDDLKDIANILEKHNIEMTSQEIESLSQNIDGILSVLCNFYLSK